MENYYKILGIPYNATNEDIGKSYRMLVRKYHPDINKDPNAIEKFKNITNAYKVLRDSNFKKEYDKKLRNFIINTYYKNNIINKNYYKNDTSKTHNTIKKDSFVCNIKKYFYKIQTKIKKIQNINLLRNMFIFKKKINKTKISCQIIEVLININEAILGTSKCILVNNANVIIDIPIGAYDGLALKFYVPSQHAEIIAIIRLIPDEYLSMEKKGLIINFPISFYTSIYGGKVLVPTLDGLYLVTIPQNTNSGTQLLIENKGCLYANGKRGNLYLKILIQTQENINNTNYQKAIQEIDKFYNYNKFEKIIKNIFN